MATGAGTVGEALRARPLRYLVSRWPLRALAYVVSGVPVGLFTLLWLPVSAVVGVVALTPLAVWPLATLERRRLALLGGPVLLSPHTAPARAGLRPWLRTRYAEAATWRELAYAVLHATVLLAGGVAAVVIALIAPGYAIAFLLTDVRHGLRVAVAALVILLVVVPVIAAYAVGLVAVGHGEIARTLLGPGDEEMVRTLTSSRARLLDAFEIERRRIERDLHDGAQQRLVALTMTLGLAELEHDDPAATRALVTRAAAQSRAACAASIPGSSPISACPPPSPNSPRAAASHLPSPSTYRAAYRPQWSPLPTSS
jgi:signal transduction histidine kinase